MRLTVIRKNVNDGYYFAMAILSELIEFDYIPNVDVPFDQIEKKDVEKIQSLLVKKEIDIVMSIDFLLVKKNMRSKFIKGTFISYIDHAQLNLISKNSSENEEDVLISIKMINASLSYIQTEIKESIKENTTFVYIDKEVLLKIIQKKPLLNEKDSKFKSVQSNIDSILAKHNSKRTGSTVTKG